MEISLKKILEDIVKALVDKLVKENTELKELVSRVGDNVAETESRHAAELALQGETFRDIITLAALPAGKKEEILDKYRSIMAGTDGKGAASEEATV